MRKRVGFWVFVALTVTSLIIVETALAQSIPKLSVPEFSAAFSRYSTSSTNFLFVTIKNQVIAFPSSNMDNVLRYNVRLKDHQAGGWSEVYSNSSEDKPRYPNASNTEYTQILIETSYPEHSLVDVQVEAIVGHYEMVWAFLYPMGYRFIVDGTSGWSATKTLNNDVTPPKISIEPPKQQVFTSTDVILNFTVHEQVNKATYSLDGKENVTLLENLSSSGTTTLTNLAYGSHKVIVYAWDIAGNVGASETVKFEVVVPYTIVTLIAVAIVLPIAAGLFLYFRKRINEARERKARSKLNYYF